MGDTAAISTPVRAIIADDHPLVLLAIENLIGGYPSMEVVGRAADATELLPRSTAQAVTSCSWICTCRAAPDGSGVEAVRQFRRRYPDVALIVLTMETEAAALQSVISLGVDALISKRDRIDLIHVAIVTALAGRMLSAGPAVRTLITKAAAMQRLDFVRSVLSRRELEVFTQYASGLGVTEIAGRLGRSVTMISAQKCTAMRKLSLNSDAELFRFAVEHGVVSETHTEGR